MAITNEKIEQMLASIQELKAAKEQEIEELRVKWLGKKGEITQLFDEFRTVDKEQKREFGQRLNALKNAATAKIEEMRNMLAEMASPAAASFDQTKPGDRMELGARHPISITREEIISIFSKFGYSVAEGPEIEDDWHVFSALNFPPEHPARDMQDTFFVEPGGDNPILLRTHTSSVQVRTMERMQPPIRVICPGRVFRADEVDATHSPVFHQIEGLVIDKDVNMGDLKGTLDALFKKLYGDDMETRFRPSFFPFTEPSAEVDLTCISCRGKGCRMCKGTGWIEVLGCGMVNPKVLEMCGIDSTVYSGFAFGIGVERITMLRYGIKDMRLLYEGDLRFLKQFR